MKKINKHLSIMSSLIMLFMNKLDIHLKMLAIEIKTATKCTTIMN